MQPNQSREKVAAYATKKAFLEYSKLLEELFDIQEIHKNSRRQGHPAYQQWLTCRKYILSEGNISAFSEQKELFQNAEIMLQCHAMAICSGGSAMGDIGTLALGDFSNYGDQKVLDKVKTRINNIRQYEGLLTELRQAAWYISRSHSLTVFEEEGFPDFRVELNPSGEAYLLECKRVSCNSNDNRYKSVIEKANKQFKKFNQVTDTKLPGLVLLDVCDKVTILRKNTELTDQPPWEIREIQNLIKPLIQKNCSSVSGVLILWREQILIGDLDSFTKGTMILINDRGVLTRHSSPLIGLPRILESLNLGTFSAGHFIKPKNTPNTLYNESSQYVNIPFNPYNAYY